MTFADALVWSAVPAYMAGAAMLALSVFLWLRGRSVPARAFGAYLAF